MFLKVLRNWQENNRIGAGLKLYIKKENLEQVFSCDFYKNFHRSFLWNISGRLLYRYNLNHEVFEVFFLLTYPMCICGSSGSLCICFSFTYRVIKIIQIVLTLTKSVLYVCWLKSCHLVFFSRSNNWCKEEKNREKSSECFTHGSGKSLRF